MNGFFRLMTLAFAAIALLAAGAGAQEALLKDDFSGKKLGEMWKQTYPEDPRMKIEKGALNVKWGTVWYIPSRKFSIADYPGGLRLVADMKFYPRTGYEWQPTSHPHALGFQNNKSGVGTVYARFTVEDFDRDGTVDSVKFMTKSTKQQYVTQVKGYNPRTDREFHQFRIDWLPDRVEAYLDGKLVTTHDYPLDEPLWVVGRNEYCGTIIDNFNVSAIPAAAKREPDKVQAAQPQIAKKLALRSTEGLVGLWRFDEGTGNRVMDASGKENHGAIRGTARWVSGVSGKAVYLNGVDTFVLVRSSHSLDLKDATIEAWLYVEKLGGGIAFSDGANWENNRLNVHLSTGAGADGRAFFTHSDGKKYVSTPGPAMPVKQWCHIAITCDGKTKKLYLNGSPAMSAPQQLEPVTQETNLRIGFTPGLAPGYFQGAIDEVAVYSRALSAAEIAADARRHTPPKKAPSAVAAVVSDYAEPVRFPAMSLSAPLSAEIVKDAQASEGTAIELNGAKKRAGDDRISAEFPVAKSSGQYVLKIRINARDMYDLGKGWRVEVRVGDEVVAWDVFHGYHFKGVQGYREFSIPFYLSEPGLKPAASMFWIREDTSKPVVRVDHVEIARVGDLPALQITRVWPDRIRYRTDEEGTVTVTCRNTTTRDVAGVVTVELIHDLNAPKILGRHNVNLAPGETKELKMPLRHGGDKFGYEVGATATVNGKTVHTASEYFCVTNNTYDVATHHGRFGNWEFDRKDWRKELPERGASAHFGSMVGGTWDKLKHEVAWNIRLWLDLNPSDEDLAECAAEARDAYVTWFEVYSWTEGGLVDMDPKAEIWVCGDDCHWLYSKRQIAGQVAAMKKHGIGVVTYALPYGQGLPSLDLLRERPEWFCTSREARDFTGYSVAAIKKIRAFRKRLEAAPKSKWPRFQIEANTMPSLPYLKMNFTQRDVIDFAADRLIDSIKTYGWDGLRWDCGNLETGRIWGQWFPFLDMYGKPLCADREQMVAQTVEHVRYFRQRIRKFRPDFTFGLNWGGPNPLNFPRLTDAFMRDGGWLLDEEIRRASWHDSAIRFWDKYYEYLSDRGEFMTSRGGHYNPYGLHIIVPGTFHAAYMYHMILGFAGHGHPEFYLRSKVFPIGDTAQFAVRFGRYLFDAELRRVENPERFVKVGSSRPLWWQRSVLRKRLDAAETWVVHLVNPPKGKAIEDNVTSELAPPVRRATVSIQVPDGRNAVRAWALTSESWTTGDRPKTQAVPLDVRRAGGKATVSVPEILFWKVIVFEFK